MNDNLRKLYAVADGDEAFAKALADLLSSARASEAALAELARDHGVEVSEADVAALIHPAAGDAGELDEAALEAVVGGTTTISCSSGARFLFASR